MLDNDTLDVVLVTKCAMALFQDKNIAIRHSLAKDLHHVWLYNQSLSVLQ